MGLSLLALILFGLYAVQATPADEVKFLQDFQASTGHWKGYDLTGWLIPCQQKLDGVFCAEGGRNIVQFIVNNKDFEGTIPVTIGGLTMAYNVRMYGNRLIGNLPDSIGSMLNLEECLLDYNSISGTIPDTYKSLIKLKHVGLGYNCISGGAENIPGTVQSILLDRTILDCSKLSPNILSKSCNNDCPRCGTNDTLCEGASFCSWCGTYCFPNGTCPGCKAIDKKEECELSPSECDWCGSYCGINGTCHVCTTFASDTECAASVSNCSWCGTYCNPFGKCNASVMNSPLYGMIAVITSCVSVFLLSLL